MCLSRESLPSCSPLFIISPGCPERSQATGDANVMPIHKHGQKEGPGNSRPASLTLVPGKAMEQIIPSVITQHVQNNQGIRPSQFGVVTGRSCLNNLISLCDSVTFSVAEGKAVDVSAWTRVKL